MKSLFASIKITLAFCLILFTGYVLVLCVFAWAVQPNGGQAEMVKVNGRIVGAANVGQQFTQMKYFWGRPSAVDYNGEGSGGSNKSVSNPDYLAQVGVRIDTLLKTHPYLDRKDIPSDMVTASGSGLDPHISPEAAAIQVRRVAEARSMSAERVAQIVSHHTERPLFGSDYINVLELNVALDNEKAN